MQEPPPSIRRAPQQPLPTAFHVMTKPIGPICNLGCRYCFYLEKEEMYVREGRKERPSWQMPDDVLETYIQQYIEQQEAPEISFAWQGGEPTLLGVRFFRKVVELQHRYAGGKQIVNALQTNGTLLNDEWGRFLKEHSFLVGLSVDGPREIHDAYRVDKHGAGTFDAVMRGLQVLKRHKVDFNTLTVVNRVNSREPERVYRFLKETGSGFIQFIPLVERAEATSPGPDLPNNGQDRTSPPAPLLKEEGAKETTADGGAGGLGLWLSPPPAPDEPGSPVTEWSVRPDDWGRFLTTIFDIWVRSDVGRVFVQQFDVALGIWSGGRSSVCVFSERCGQAMAIEHNGDVYSCDHYVYPRYRLGNVRDIPLIDMARSPQQIAFGNDKADALPRYCRECEVRFACNGECPKHRFEKTPDGEPGLNYLCAGYKRFFKHVDPAMRTMTALLTAGRAPAEIMRLPAQPARAVAGRAIGRNDPCPCGSGKKYKQCCLGKP